MKSTLSRVLLCIAIGTTLLTLILSPLYARADDLTTTHFPEEELHSYIQDATSKLSLPGMAVAISQNGELLFSEGYGNDISPDTIFYIGSISKSFTALAIMQLVEQKLISLDTSVSTYLSEFKVSDDITIRHLLNQTSGMSEAGYMPSLPPSASFDELIADMNNMTLTNTPGEEFVYFNQNYSLLGAVVEAVSQQPYPDYMQDYVFHPLGLTKTSAKGVIEIPGHMSFFGFSIPRVEPFSNYDLPGGYITSTVNDMISYLDLIQSRDSVLGISPDAVELLLGTAPYGMGWMSGTFAGHQAVHHGGSLPGYVADAIMLTEEGYNITFLTNKNHLTSGFFMYPEFSRGIVSILTNQSPANPFNRIWIFRVLFVLFILNLFSITRNIVRQIKSKREYTLAKRFKAILFNLAIPISVYLLVPIASYNLLGRGMTWQLAFLLLPDLIGWLFIGMASHIIIASIHITKAIKEIK
jgi:CubicO group peptidase (beta-lactamase class C family)